MALAEFSNDETATATSMAVVSAGHVAGTHSMTLLTGPESMKAMKQARVAAQSYPVPKER